jgi:hypothetical protein
MKASNINIKKKDHIGSAWSLGYALQVPKYRKEGSDDESSS